MLAGAILRFLKAGEDVVKGRKAVCRCAIDDVAAADEATSKLDLNMLAA